MQFPPELLAANTEWNNFIRDHGDFVHEYSKKRERIIQDYDNGNGIITDTIYRERLQDLYEQNLPLSLDWARIFQRVKNAERMFAPHANAKAHEENVPYWAKIVDDTLEGGINHEANPTQRTIHIPGVSNESKFPDGTVKRRKGRVSK